MEALVPVLEVVEKAVQRSGRSNQRKGHAIKQISVGSGVLREVRPTLERICQEQNLEETAIIAVLVDRVPYKVDGRDVKQQMFEALAAAAWQLRLIMLDDGTPHLHATKAIIQQAVDQARGASLLVSVGGGTLTDIGKMTSLALDGIPHVVVQTAASVDGFTDDVSVILIDGVKRTVPSRWPDVVLADVDVVREAPEHLNQAGFGELMSMFVAPADWRAAELFGMDDSFDPSMVRMLEYVGTGIDEWSSGLRDGLTDSTTALTRALAVRGVATGLAGTTALLSGAEHLISHMLDMYNASLGLPTGAHGAQVGVGSLVAACMWERFFDLAREDQWPPISKLDEAVYRNRVEAAFGHMSSDGQIVAECWKDQSAKIDRWNSNIDRIRHVFSHESDWLHELRQMVMTPQQMAINLRNAGAPTSFADLGVSPDLSEWVVRNCGYMRNRLTVVDLLDFTNSWTDQDAHEIVRNAESWATAYV